MALRLHIFNPEHDIALAHGSPLFTSPRAGRQLRADLGFLPALWAGEESVVWTDQPQEALENLRRLGLDVPPGLFVDTPTLRRLAHQVEAVDPWGWDAALCHQLQRLGVNPRILPTDEELKEVRALSHRRTAKELLDSIHNTSLINNTIEDSIKATEEAIEKTSKTIELVGETIEATREAIELTGEAIEEKDEAALLQQLARWPEAVLKAPWSSSGRGVRMVSAPLHSSVLQWALGVMRRQGSLMVEPLYHKVADFGMEFLPMPKASPILVSRSSTPQVLPIRAISLLPRRRNGPSSQAIFRPHRSTHCASWSCIASKLFPHASALALSAST